ncbi:hypothetical protein H7849_06525 [Alloacidobacterium dinghuense]|uniref:Uncharacterized protein n=1 Tax=Alloacidobacterium dinghuense TaxID=2763107 RepID=A0A7G8BM22_9BACT|nr:hypothetical protein [Alloacidobacterium dinghuense]QNI33592.1 hypothetical protein H7849_06525 [Alloacidobacterium dinghuense]
MTRFIGLSFSGPSRHTAIPGIVFLAIIFWLSCVAVITWIYGPGKPPQAYLAAPIEMACAITLIALPTWIRPMFFPEPGRRWNPLAIAIAMQSFVLLELYAVAIYWAGADSPVVTVFGFSATRIFREDSWAVFPLICVPIMSCISGIFCATASWMMTRLLR